MVRNNNSITPLSFKTCGGRSKSACVPTEMSADGERSAILLLSKKEKRKEQKIIKRKANDISSGDSEVVSSPTISNAPVSNTHPLQNSTESSDSGEEGSVNYMSELDILRQDVATLRSQLVQQTE